MYGFQANMINSLHSSIVNCNATMNGTEIVNTLVNSTDFFQPCIEMNSLDWSFAVSIIYIGGAVGNWLPDLLDHWMSPIWVTLIGNLPGVLGAVLMSLFSNKYVFILSRFLMGFTGGCCWAVVAIYLSDIAPSSLRGSMGVTITLLNFCASVFAQLLGIFMAFHPGWRIVPAISIVFFFLQISMLFFVPNSPRWLVKHHRQDAARIALKSLRGKDPSENEFEDIRKRLTKNERAINGVPLWKRLFRWSFLKYFILITFLNIMHPFTGANIVSQYSTDIFKKTGMTIPAVATAIVGLSNIISVTISMFTVDALGRRTLMIIGVLGQTVSFATLSLAYIFTPMVSWFQWISLLSIIGYVFSNSLALFPLRSLLATELFPADLEQFAVGMTGLIKWFAIALSTFIFPLLDDALDVYVFVPFFCLNVICLVVVILFLPETKNKTLESLQESVSYGKNIKHTVDELDPDYLDLLEGHGNSPMKFLEFLKREGDCDLWEFRENVMEYKKCNDLELRSKRGKEIFDRFICHDSDQQIAFSMDFIVHVSEQVDSDPNVWGSKDSLNIFDLGVKELENNQLLESWMRMNEY